ncbi:porin [Terriglobus albidus]|uniref:porin n=1 Tax=Terriglobus albidus TaxID=1592106 RepID=UPI0021E0B580|nr:porin [Terriglobus albidus]
MKILVSTVTLLLLVAAFPLTAQSTQEPSAARRAEIAELRAELARLAARLDALEKTEATSAAEPTASANGAPAPVSSLPSSSSSTTASTTAPASAAAPPTVDDFLHGTTLGFGLDGYYGYNFNQPIGRANLLRVYDVTSNSFSINQASLVAERIPTTDSRFGGRLDLQFGQATETLQGSYANEQRAQVWRNLFQAYGSYLAPVGSGLQIDFGKFASALGVEGNYTKDQIAYSRSFTFNYLPYYHMGVRANYNITPKINVTYWLVNGAQQTEDFNGFKSQAFILNFKPSSTVSWNVNYYFGQEQRDVLPTDNPGAPTSPTQPGLPTTNITPAPNGRNHIFDTYATWNVTPKLTLVGEADYVISRVQQQSNPAHTAIGAVYFRYALPKDWSIGSRFEYFDDRGALFSGETQALKEFTFVADRKLAPGMLARAEYRRDFSNQNFFTTDRAGVLVKQQPTATLGLIFWWGNKQGQW